jgi:predicted metal-binding transcription factor (methanogenesis marker protein 9)
MVNEQINKPKWVRKHTLVDEKITKPNYLRKQSLADEQIKHSQVSKKALTYGWKKKRRPTI